MINDFLEYLRINYYHRESYSPVISEKIISIFNKLDDYAKAINFFYDNEKILMEQYNKHVDKNYNDGQKFSYFLSIWVNTYNNRKYSSDILAKKIMQEDK